jgi:hypothetical protein
MNSLEMLDSTSQTEFDRSEQKGGDVQVEHLGGRLCLFLGKRGSMIAHSASVKLLV